MGRSLAFGMGRGEGGGGGRLNDCSLGLGKGISVLGEEVKCLVGGERLM